MTEISSSLAQLPWFAAATPEGDAALLAHGLAVLTAAAWRAGVTPPDAGESLSRSERARVMAELIPIVLGDGDYESLPVGRFGCQATRSE